LGVPGAGDLAGVSWLVRSWSVFVLVGWGFRFGRVYYLTDCVWLGSAGGCVAVDVEQVGELLLGGGHVGEHAAGAGAAFAAVVVEEHGFLDPAEGGEEFGDGQVQSGVLGFAAHQVGDGQREDAVEDVDADLGVAPVVDGSEGDDVGVFHLPEPGLDLGLGAVGGDHVGGGPGVSVGEQDPFAEGPGLEASAGAGVGAPGGPLAVC
jgi:hypothetical protein